MSRLVGLSLCLLLLFCVGCGPLGSAPPRTAVVTMGLGVQQAIVSYRASAIDEAERIGRQVRREGGSEGDAVVKVRAAYRRREEVVAALLALSALHDDWLAAFDSGASPLLSTIVGGYCRVRAELSSGSYLLPEVVPCPQLQ